MSERQTVAKSRWCVMCGRTPPPSVDSGVHTASASSRCSSWACSLESRRRGWHRFRGQLLAPFVCALSSMMEFCSPKGSQRSHSELSRLWRICLRPRPLGRRRFSSAGGTARESGQYVCPPVRITIFRCCFATGSPPGQRLPTTAKVLGRLAPPVRFALP